MNRIEELQQENTLYSKEIDRLNRELDLLFDMLAKHVENSCINKMLAEEDKRALIGG